MPMNEDTDHMQAIYLKNISPAWVKQIDDEAGEIIAKNGGNFRLEASFEGESCPKWYDIIVRHLPFKKRMVK